MTCKIISGTYANGYKLTISYTGVSLTATGQIEGRGPQLTDPGTVNAYGQIRDFSKTGATALDLLDIAFGGSTTASFSGTATSGTLTVTDGTHTAKITLEGNYTTSAFTTSSDGHGGTKIVDPTTSTQSHVANTAPLLAFIDAMAGMGAGGGPVTAPDETWRTAQATLATPRGQIA